MARGATDYAADAERRVPGCGYGLRSFRCVLDERHQDGARAEVEDPLDQHHVVPRHANDRLGRAGGHRLQLRQHARHFVRAMFRVDEDPVEARAGDDLRDDVAAERAPQPDLRPLLPECGFEPVGRQVQMTVTVHRILRACDARAAPVRRAR